MVVKLSRRAVRNLTRLGLSIFLGFYILLYIDNQYRVLPNSIHNHLPVHRPGHLVTDITIKTCTKPNLLSACRLDPSEWHRVNKDIYLQSSWLYSAFIHYKTKDEKELTYDDHVILDVKISRSKPAKDDSPHSKWESRPGGLWLKRTTRRHENNFDKLVTAVDLLYGPDAVDPRLGWEVKAPSLSFEGTLDPHITVRFGNHLHSHENPPLRMRRDGKFKILQVSDLHLSTGTGRCRDLFPPSKEACEADPRTLEFVGKTLDLEKPDLVVLSGDQVNGETAPDAQTAIFKYAELFASRHIPYATIFGNHDDLEPSSLSREAAMSLISRLPYSYSEAGPHQVSGVGNYYLEVLAPSSSHSALTIYFFDTHGNSPDNDGYDWVKDDQIAWFKQTSQALKEKHDKYTHIHIDMAFIHIPLPEYNGPRDKKKNPEGEKLSPVYGDWKERVMAPKRNTGLRDALVQEGVSVVSCGHDHVNSFCGFSTKDVPISSSRPRSDPDGGSSSSSSSPSRPNTNARINAKINAISGSDTSALLDSAPAGNLPPAPPSPPPPPPGAAVALSPQKIQQLTDRNKIWLCYGGGAGYGGYGGHGGYSRRVRAFEFDSGNGSLKTWLRVETDVEKVVDDLVLVREGRPVPS